MEPATSITSTFSGRRRSLIESASRKLSSLGQPKSRKTRLPNEEQQTSKVTISSPYDFRDLSNSSSEEDNSKATHAQTPTLHSLRQKDNQYHGSPLDKPLPSLPVATIVTSSPVKIRRSLIDAQEKPLRRSISPQHHAFEDWPSLSPQRQRSSPVTLKMPTPIKPSISESLTDRIKKLNLEDDAILTSKGKANTMSKSKHAIESNRIQSPQLTPGTKSVTPMVRHNKTSELRLRLSAATSEAQKRKTANTSSPLSNIATNVTKRSRSIKRSDDTQRGRSSIAHSRSRSRHRVTAEGSPYVVAMHDASDSQNKSERKSLLALDSSKVDTDFTGSLDNPRTSKIFGANSDVEQTQSVRKSSIPIPKRQLRDYRVNDIDIEFESRPHSHHASDTSGSCCDPDEKDQVETGRGRRNASPFPTLTVFNANGIEDADSIKSQPEITQQHLVDEGLNQEKDYARQSSASPVSSSVGQPAFMNDKDLDAEFDLTIKNEHGPILRISRQADELLQNHKCGSHGPTENCDCAQKSQLVSDSIKFSNTRFYSAFGPDDIVDGKSMDGLDEIDTDQQPHSISRKPVPNREEGDPYYVKLMALEPMTEIGQAPENQHSTTSGWPFREPATAPFENLDTPERLAARGIFGFTSINQDQSKLASSRSKSIEDDKENNESAKEIIKNVTSIQRSGTQRSILANTHADMHAATIAVNKPNRLPTQSSHRLDNGVRVTGLRTPSARAPTLMVGERSPEIARASKANSAPQHMKSFHRSTQNITVLGTPSGKNTDNPILSPVPTAGSVSTGKGVINNIRGLFHKRSNLRSSVTASIHRPARNIKPSNSTKVSPFSPLTTRATLSSPIPRSPQVKRTSSLAKRAAPPPPRHFPTNKVVRPLESPGPVEAKDESSTTVTNTDHKKEKATKPEAKPKTPLSLKLQNDAPELESATDLVHRLLDRAQEHTTPYRTAEQFLELAKTLVTILTAAREAEKFLESAKIAASKCEIRCVEIRKEVARVDAQLRKMICDLDVDIDGVKF